MGYFFVFLKIFLQLSSKIYWALKKRETVNPAMLVFLYLRNIKGTHSKYLQNKIYECDI